MQMDDAVLSHLMRDFEAFVRQERRKDMESYRKPREEAREPVEHDEGLEALPPECAAGECEHLEHMRDDELEGL